MPLDEDEQKEFVPKIGIKQVSGQKSMFDNKVNKQSQQEFEQKVQNSQEKSAVYKKRASELFIRFNKIISDKTLVQNRNLFSNESEKEMLQNMIQLAIEINDDPNEQHNGMGSLTWITLLFKTCLSQRDRLNDMEFAIAQLQKKILEADLSNIKDFINKEIVAVLDKKKQSE